MLCIGASFTELQVPLNGNRDLNLKQVLEPLYVLKRKKDDWRGDIAESQSTSDASRSCHPDSLNASLMQSGLVTTLLSWVQLKRRGRPEWSPWVSAGAGAVPKASSREENPHPGVSLTSGTS
ncbi:hypothetical protein GN956_G25059 [Arapaima gigas]